VAPKGKWAQGITPRNFSWIIKDKLAVCERPGGYGANHRRVRRQEEIIWIREQGFTHVVSLLSSPHNLHNYDELGMPWLHRPFNPLDNPRHTVGAFYPELRELLRNGEKLIMHGSELGDGITGLMAGYLLWTGDLGRPVTYGCVLLSLENAAALYQWAEDGVIVEVRG
jgi:hypothetical protein